jgi:hypothetical protein
MNTDYKDNYSYMLYKDTCSEKEWLMNELLDKKELMGELLDKITANHSGTKTGVPTRRKVASAGELLY